MPPDPLREALPRPIAALVMEPQEEIVHHSGMYGARDQPPRRLKPLGILLRFRAKRIEFSGDNDSGSHLVDAVGERRGGVGVELVRLTFTQENTYLNHQKTRI